MQVPWQHGRQGAAAPTQSQAPAAAPPQGSAQRTEQSPPPRQPQSPAAGAPRHEATPGRPAASRGARVGRVVLRWLRFNGIVVGIYLLAFVAWELGSRIFAVPTFILPSPLVIAERVADNPAELAAHTSVTFQEVVIGFLLGAAASIPLGVVLIYSQFLERLVYPFLVAFQATPKVALAPILVVWFGFGITSKVVLAMVTAAFPIVINTVIGMRQTPREMLYLMRSLRASAWQIFVKARLPVAAPYIFGGLKIGITLAVVGAVVGEFIASNSGLGYLLLVANNNLDTPMLFAVVVMLAVMSGVLFYAIEAAEAVLLPRPLRRGGGQLDPGAPA